MSKQASRFHLRILASALWCLFALSVAAKTPSKVDQWTWSDATDVDVDLTVASGDRLLIAWCGNETLTGAAELTMAVGGQSMVAVTFGANAYLEWDHATTSDGHMEVFTADEAQLSSLTGIQNLNVTGDDSTWGCGAALFTNVENDTLHDSDTTVIVTGDPTSITVNLDSQDDGLIFVISQPDTNESHTWTAGMTEVVDYNPGTPAGRRAAAFEVEPSGLTNQGYTATFNTSTPAAMAVGLSFNAEPDSGGGGGGGNITFVGVSTLDEHDTTTFTVTPDFSGVSWQANDLAIAQLHRGNPNSQEDWTGPAGWTQDFDEYVATSRVRQSAMFYRVLQNGDDETPTFDSGETGAGDEMSGFITIWRGADTTTPIDTTTVTANGTNDATPTNSAITTVTNNAMVLLMHFATHDDISTATAPTNYTLRGATMTPGSSYNNRQHFVASREIATAGTETPGVWQHTASPTGAAEWLVATVALRPSSGSGAADPGAEPQLVRDTWTGTNSTSADAHPPDFEQASEGNWTIGKRLSTAGTITATIQSNQIELEVNDGMVERDVGTPNGVLRQDWIPTASQDNRVFLAGRKSADGSHLECQFLEPEGTAHLARVQTDTVTILDSDLSVSYSEATTEEVLMACQGNVCRCYLDSNVLVEAASSFNNSETTWGFGRMTASVDQVFDNTHVMRAFEAIDPDTGLPVNDPDGFFFNVSTVAGDIFWMDPDNIVDNSPVDLLFYAGGAWFLDPQAAFVGVTEWGIERYDSTLQTLSTSTWAHTTVSTSPATAPVFDGDGIANQTCEISVPITPWDASADLSTQGVPLPTWSDTTAGCTGNPLPPGLAVDPNTGVVFGTCTDDTGSPYTSCLEATNASGHPQDTFTYTVNTPSGAAPTCTQIPIQRKVVGELVDLDLSTYCTAGVITYACGDENLPTGISRVDASFSGTLSLPEHKIQECQATNVTGSTRVMVTWEIKSSTLTTCDEVESPIETGLDDAFECI